MFSGIVQKKAKVFDVGSGKLTLESDYFLNNSFAHGASIMVSGVCLSLTEQSANKVSFDILSETLDKTILGALLKGDEVNIEPSLKLESTLDGHFVTGHVDKTLVVKSLEHLDSTTWRVCFSFPVEFKKFIAQKGSVCISGVSLTAGQVFDDYFEVFLVPVTREKTTLGNLKVGDKVNFEVDCLSRYVVNFLEAQQNGA